MPATESTIIQLPNADDDCIVSGGSHASDDGVDIVMCASGKLNDMICPRFSFLAGAGGPDGIDVHDEITSFVSRE